MSSYSVIITSSHIPSHPKITIIKDTIESLSKTNMAKDTKIILAHDFSEHINYIQYLQNLKEYIVDKANIQIVVRDTHGHLTGNIRNAFNFINTEYVLIIQHDLPFVENFDLEKVVEDMKNNPELKYVRFNKRKNIKTGSDALNDLFGKQFVLKNYTYTRTPSWSDNNHLCRSDYYKDLILKECDDGKPMELYLIKKSQTEDIHNKYGTYIFGELNNPRMIKHTDGRKSI
jgi:GTP:adenosylcobinamide-phosphate guanylyltransferase